MIRWINEKIEQTNHLWYCWIIAICGFETLNVTLVKRYAPFWCDIVISLLLLSIMGYYLSVFYRYMYDKYKNYLKTSHSEIINKIGSFEKDIKQLTADIQKDYEKKYSELLSKVDNSQVELKNEIDLKTSSINENIFDKSKQITQDIHKIADEINQSIVVLNKAMDEAFRNSNNLLELKTNKLENLTNENKNKIQQIILNKFSEQVQSSQNNLLIFKNSIKEVLDSDLNVLAKVVSTVDEASEKINKSIDKHFESAISNSNVKQSDLNKNIRKLAEELSVELKAMREENINISNQNKKDIINEADKVANDNHSKEMELLNNIFNECNKNHENAIEQINQTKQTIVEKIEKKSSVFNSNIVGMQDVINEKHFDIKKQIQEVTDRIMENTSSIVNSEHENLSEQLKGITDSVIMQLVKDKSDLIEKTVEHKDMLAEKLNDVLNETISKFNKQAEVIASGIELNHQGLSEVSNKIINNTNELVYSNQEKLQIQIKEVSETITTQIDNDKKYIIEGVKQGYDSLVQSINNMLTQSESRINENTTEVSDRIKVTEDTINSLIMLKQNEIINKLENINKESENNLKTLLDITNDNVQTGIRGLTEKIQNSSNAVNSIVVDEISNVRNEQSQIIKLISNLIEKEKERQNALEQAVDVFQGELESLQKEIITQIGNIINAESKEKKQVLNNTIKNNNDQIAKLSEVLSNKAYKLDSNMEITLSMVKAIKESGINNIDKISYILNKILKKDDELSICASNISLRQEDAASKIKNLEIQMQSFNNLFAMLKKVSKEDNYKSETAITKNDPNRKEKIHDDESGITVFNTFSNDTLKYSEMHESGRKVYSADYDLNGNIVSSKNYNKQGEIVIENSYHANGQVKVRKEKVKENGKITTKITKFDINGKKL